MKQNFNKRNIVIATIILIWVLVPIVIALIIREGAPGSIEISGYDAHMANMPQSSRRNINQTLYSILRESSGNNVSDIDDAIIREDSLIDEYFEDLDFHFSTFVVDISSIRQSYIVFIRWADNPEVAVPGDILRFGCLVKEELIYGEFDCKNIMKINDETSLLILDPLGRLLPRITDNYRLTMTGYGDNSKGNLMVEIYTPIDVPNSEIRNFINQQLNDVRNWIVENNIDPDDYNIDFMRY